MVCWLIMVWRKALFVLKSIQNFIKVYVWMWTRCFLTIQLMVAVLTRVWRMYCFNPLLVVRFLLRMNCYIHRLIRTFLPWIPASIQPIRLYKTRLPLLTNVLVFIRSMQVLKLIFWNTLPGVQPVVIPGQIPSLLLLLMKTLLPIWWIRIRVWMVALKTKNLINGKSPIRWIIIRHLPKNIR